MSLKEASLATTPERVDLGRLQQIVWGQCMQALIDNQLGNNDLAARAAELEDRYRASSLADTPSHLAKIVLTELEPW